MDVNNKRGITPAGNLKAPSRETRVDWISWAWAQTSSTVVSNRFNIYRRYIEASNVELVPEANVVGQPELRRETVDEISIERAASDLVSEDPSNNLNEDHGREDADSINNQISAQEPELTEEEKELLSDLGTKPTDAIFLGYEIIAEDER